MQTSRALVTGAGTRLGRAMALYLAKRGYDVAVHYLSSDKDAQAVVEDIRSLGQQAVAVRADLLEEAQTLSLVPNAAEQLGGPLSVLINNASVFEYDNISSANRTSWDRHIESNLRAPVVLTQAFATQAAQPGTDGNNELLSKSLVVNMVDQRVKKLTPEFMSYTIAKMGLWAFTQTAAQALAPGIRVNAIGPGPTLIGAKQSQSHFAKQRSGTILKRGSDATDVTRALGYLIESPSVTGQLLLVDGGQHLGWQTPDVVGNN